MESHLGTPAPPSEGRHDRYADDSEKVAGWLLFAGTMVMIAGILNVIYGISGIGNANWLEANTDYVFSSMKTWGWIVLLTGAAQVLTAFGVWMRNTFATWLGIVFAGLNAIIQLLMIPAFPLLSLALFAIDVLVIYGLAVHGGRVAET